jgi:hypothetical protein
VSYTSGRAALTIMRFPITQRKEDMMSTRSGFLRTTAAVALATLGLAGCGMMQSMSSSTETFTASLSGAQESPAVSTGGNGNAEVTYDRGSSTLNYRVAYSGLTGPATAAHIHGPAGPGQNAGVVVPFPNAGSSPITGQIKLTPEQFTQLSSGQWYVNVHTAAHPAGEIRGQLRKR